MTFFSAIPVPETTVGIALETTRGEPKAPGYWIPVMGPKYKPDLKLLPDEGLRGSMVTMYDEIPSLRFDSHGWDQYPYLDTLPVLLRALLGSSDNLTAAPVATELTKEAKSGEETAEVEAPGPEGSTIVIDPGTANVEVFTATKVVGKVVTLSGKLAHNHAAKAPVTVATELVVAALAGATHILTAVTIPEGSYVTVGAPGSTIETHLTGKPKEVKAKEFEIPLVYPLAFGHPINSFVSGQTKHRFSLLNNDPKDGNQPPSCTLTDFGGEFTSEAIWRQLPAAQLDSLVLNGTAETLPKLVTNWFANPSITPSPPTASFSTAEAPPGWTVQASLGGTQIGYLVSWEFSLKRNVKPVPAITGTQAYYQYYAGAIEATAKVTVLEDPKATWLTAYENGELESVDLTLGDVQNGFACNLHSTKAKFITGDLDRSKEWVEVPLEVQLIPSAADALAGGVSPIVATVANGQTTTF